MKEKLLAIGVVVLTPLGVIAGGSHSGGHHAHAEPAAVQQGKDDHADRHDHHADGHAGMHASSVGEPATVDAVSRTIRVDLLDTMRFAFDVPLDLKHGEVVRFVVTNRGQIRHEFSIGSADEQDAHREMMRNMPNMVHDDPNAVTVDPGQTRELIWRFQGDQPVVFACNIPGHSEAGMVAKAMLKP